MPPTAEPSRDCPQLDHHHLDELLRALINIYSPSGKEEDIQLYLEELLTGAGLTVQRQEIEEDRYNLVVPLGPREPNFYLVGHVDTVTARDLDEYEAREENGLIYGLGSADMKGGCAAMVEGAGPWFRLAFRWRPILGVTATRA